MYKVQLTFTPQEANILAAKANQLGYSMTKYIKLLLGREVLEEVENFPAFHLSKKVEEKANLAMQEYKAGKAIEISSFKDLE